jgi:hypothetical protein
MNLFDEESQRKIQLAARNDETQTCAKDSLSVKQFVFAPGVSEQHIADVTTDLAENEERPRALTTKHDSAEIWVLDSNGRCGAAQW